MTTLAESTKRAPGNKEPFAPEELEAITADFLRDGYRLIPQVLSRHEVQELRAGIDTVFNDAKYKENVNGPDDAPYILVRLFETNPVFEDTSTQ